MNEIAKFVILIGIILIVIGLFMLILPKTDSLWKLPGDIVIKKDRFVFYFPLATSVILSIILTIIFYLIGRH